jgi:hypothetical protein
VLEGQRRATARCSICYVLRVCLSKRKRQRNDAPYRSISMNFIWLDRLFPGEYRYGSIVAPFSRSEVTN